MNLGKPVISKSNFSLKFPMLYVSQSVADFTRNILNKTTDNFKKDWVVIAYLMTTWSTGTYLIKAPLKVL